MVGAATEGNCVYGSGFNERRLALDNCVVDLYVCLYLSMHLSVCVCVH